MALNGAAVGWNETNPDNTRNAGLGAQDIRSLTSAVRTGLDSEHVWPAAGGLAGVHRHGSARPFYGTQSQVSSQGTSGRIMVTSDTSRFFGVGSDGTVLLGAGPTSLSLGTYPGTVPQRHQWIEEIGVENHVLGGITVTFPNSGFSGVPLVFLSSLSDGYTGVSNACPVMVTITATQFTTVGSKCTLMWRSLGTRVL